MYGEVLGESDSPRNLQWLSNDLCQVSGLTYCSCIHVYFTQSVWGYLFVWLKISNSEVCVYILLPTDVQPLLSLVIPLLENMSTSCRSSKVPVEVLLKNLLDFCQFLILNFSAFWDSWLFNGTPHSTQMEGLECVYIVYVYRLANICLGFHIVFWDTTQWCHCDSLYHTSRRVSFTQLVYALWIQTWEF